MEIVHYSPDGNRDWPVYCGFMTFSGDPDSHWLTDKKENVTCACCHAKLEARDSVFLTSPAVIEAIDNGIWNLHEKLKQETWRDREPLL